MEPVAPVVGRQCSFELTIPGWLTDLRATPPGRDRQLLSGVVDGIYEHGLLLLRLAPDCLPMLEGLPGEVVMGQELSINVPHGVLEIWPYGV